MITNTMYTVVMPYTFCLLSVYGARCRSSAYQDLCTGWSRTEVPRLCQGMTEYQPWCIGGSIALMLERCTMSFATSQWALYDLKYQMHPLLLWCVDHSAGWYTVCDFHYRHCTTRSWSSRQPLLHAWRASLPSTKNLDRYITDRYAPLLVSFT